MNDEALQQLRWKLEALERFLKPYIRKDGDDSPTQWDNERALGSIYGSAVRDDPPDGWGDAKLAQFARGRAYGEDILALNVEEHLHWIMEVINNPDQWTNEAIHKRWGIDVDTTNDNAPHQEK
jgi:hypothetical protein